MHYKVTLLSSVLVLEAMTACFIGHAQQITRDDFDLPGLNLDMPFDSVLAQLGKPISIHCQAVDTNYVGFYYQSLIAWRNNVSNTLYGLDIRSPELRTRRGLKLGDSVSKAERLYGSPIWRGGDFDFLGPYEYPIQRPYYARLYLAGDYHLGIISRDTIVTKTLMFRDLWLDDDDYNVGFLKLDSPFVSVAARLPKPDSERVFLENPGYIGAYYPHFVIWREATKGSVVALDVYDPSFETNRGLRIGDSVEKIEKLYGNRNWTVGHFSRVGPYDASFKEYTQATIFGASYYLIFFTKNGKLVKILSYAGVDE